LRYRRVAEPPPTRSARLASRLLVHSSGILAVAGTLLMINGYFLLVHLPLE
jgi:hypothetical protein